MIRPLKLMICLAGILCMLPVTAQQRATPDPVWLKFWKPFQISARMGKAQYLKQFMATEFIYPVGPKPGPGDKRDAAIKFIEASPQGAQLALSRSVSLGWADSPAYTKQFGKRARVSPAEATDPNYKDWRAVFIQLKDKTWVWKMFVKGK